MTVITCTPSPVRACRLAGSNAANVVKANLGNTGLTRTQLYSTNSYRARNLRGIGLNGNDLTAWDFGGQDLSNASLVLTRLTDANLDGAVDELDFDAWNDHRFTHTAAWCSGDFNADGVVDGLDFVIWNDNKFTSAAVPLPEPSTGLLGLMAGCMCISRRRYPR